MSASPERPWTPGPDHYDEEDVARLRAVIDALVRESRERGEALERIAAREHSDTCSHALVPSEDCDCHRAIALDALRRLPGGAS